MRVCARCGGEFTIGDIVIAGRVFFKARSPFCTPCTQAQEEEREEEKRQQEAEKREREAEARRSSILSILHDAGVNAWDHRNATLESFDASESGRAPVDAVRTFVAEVKAAERYDQVRGLYLYGDTGTGKSHLAAAAARELLLDVEYSGEVVFDHALRLIGKIQRTYNSEESADAVLDKRINAGVWILDDLGTENPSADVVRRLTEIFTERAMRPTLVTSNLDPEMLESRHPEFYRISSRLGPRYFRTVQVRGNDRRFVAA